jgi:type IV pilus assembly protein PilM
MFLWAEACTRRKSFETAEELKVGKKDAGERADKITEIMRTVSNILSTEAQRSYNFFSATYPDRLVTKVYLTGGAAKSAFLKEMLSEKIGVDVVLFDPFEGLTIEEGSLDPSLASDFNTAATVSVGLALRNQEDRR